MAVLRHHGLWSLFGLLYMLRTGFAYNMESNSSGFTGCLVAFLHGARHTYPRWHTRDTMTSLEMHFWERVWRLPGRGGVICVPFVVTLKRSCEGKTLCVHWFVGMVCRTTTGFLRLPEAVPMRFWERVLHRNLTLTLFPGACDI